MLKVALFPHKCGDILHFYPYLLQVKQIIGYIFRVVLAFCSPQAFLPCGTLPNIAS